MQALPGLLAPREDDAVLASTGLGSVRDQDAVRDDLVLARKPALRRHPRLLGDRDPPVEPLLEEAPDRRREPHPAQIAARVVRADHRSVPHRERGDAGRRRHRLVQVQEVEAPSAEHAPHAEDRARAEDDVRQRAVRGDDHRPSDRDHLRRRLAVPADPRMQGARELAGRIVPHDQAHVVPPLAERSRLELRVLDDGAPERPRERHDDANLHLERSLWFDRAAGRRPPHHPDHRRRAPERGLLHPRPRPPAGQEDGQPGRSDRLPPLLRRREGKRRLRHHLLRVSRRAAGLCGPGDDPHDRVAGRLGGCARLLGAAAAR